MRNAQLATGHAQCMVLRMGMGDEYAVKALRAPCGPTTQYKILHHIIWIPLDLAFGKFGFGYKR
jgi:hypothetical protein